MAHGTGLAMTFLGMEMQSPFIVGSGPLSHNAAGMIAAHRNGAGAVVTKTIRNNPARNPIPHIAADIRTKGLINSEQWSDIPGEAWTDREIPSARAAGVNVIASVGHTPQEVARWVPLVDRAGALAVELVSYDERTMADMVMAAAALTKKPIIAKLSPNWSAPLKSIDELGAMGASAFTVMDSVGPVLGIDIETARPVVGGTDGRGWLTGPPIKPIILHYVAAVSEMTDRPVIGLGGVSSAEDVVEMAMAGARAVGLCTVLMMRGMGYLENLIYDTERLLGRLGYASLAEARARFLEVAKTDSARKEDRGKPEFEFDPDRCTDCGRCRTVCSYGAQKTGKEGLRIDSEICRFCGLCVSVCPVGALSLGWLNRK